MSSRKQEMQGILSDFVASNYAGTRYLYNNVEVKETGRVARKTKKSRRTDGEESVLHEITPINLEDGSWTAWVELDDIYRIENECTDVS